MKKLLALFSVYFLALGTLCLPSSAQLQQVPPPWAIQTRQGDFLIENTTGVGAVSITMTWRMILATGERQEFQRTGLSVSGGNGPNYNSFPLPEGWLIGVSILGIGSVADNSQTYYQVWVGRNAYSTPNTAPMQLIGCSTSGAYGLGWPGGCNRPPTDGQGLNQSCAIANPAAGVNLSQNLNGTTNITCNGIANLVQGQKHWLSNIRFTLTTDANAAARQVCIRLTDANGNIYYGYCIQATQAASTIVTYDFTAGVGPTFLGAAALTVIPTTNVAGTANEVQGTLPDNLQFSDATVLTTRIVNIQVGDQISAVVVRPFWSHHTND